MDTRVLRLPAGETTEHVRVGDKVLEKHPTNQHIVTVGDKKILIVPIRCSGETRITDNINFDPVWGDPVTTNGHVFLANVKVKPQTFKFQQKFDATADEDPDTGPVMTHGDKLEPINGGHEKYCAIREGGRELLKEGFVVFADASLTVEQIRDATGLDIK